MRYISILRGINVGGHKKIKMAELKAIYLTLGFSDIITYIQSGNIIFTDTSSNIQTLINNIEDTILTHYGFEVPVLIRTTNEWDSIVKHYPFEVNALENLTTISVTLLEATPTQSAISTLQSYVKAPDLLTVHESNVYLYTPNGYGKTKLSNNFIEKKLALKATTRNWKSILKLHELSKNSTL